jgi:hypothetical protein
MLIYSESASDLPLIASCHSLSDNDCPPVRRKPILTNLRLASVVGFIV